MIGLLTILVRAQREPAEASLGRLGTANIAEAVSRDD